VGKCLEDLFPVRPFEGSKFVHVQRGMRHVGLKKPQVFPDGFEDISLRSEANRYRHEERGTRKKGGRYKAQGSRDKEEKDRIEVRGTRKKDSRIPNKG
jgi:hypothetical protein